MLKSGCLIWLWISTFWDEVIVLFSKKNLPTVTPLMPPWCVIHSLFKPPVRLFSPLVQCPSSFTGYVQKRTEFETNRLWQEKQIYIVTEETNSLMKYLKCSALKPHKKTLIWCLNLLFFLIICFNFRGKEKTELNSMTRTISPRCAAFLYCNNRCMAHRCQCL